MHGAATGIRALLLATSRPYDGLLLDLVLPDGSGLDFLRSFRRCDTSTPVAILSGHIGVQDALAAGQLGVIDVVAKPCIGEDLVALARRLTVAASSRARDLRWVASLLRNAKGGQPSATIDAALREALLAADLTTVDFLAVCRAVRESPEGVSPSAVLEDALTRSLRLDAEARALLQRVEAAVRTKPVVDRQALAALCDMRPRDLSHAIRAAAGDSYDHLRIADKVRPSVKLLLRGDTLVKQISYELGYSHHEQFDRDFRLIIGTAPSEFRGRFV